MVKNVTAMISEEAGEAFDMFTKIFRSEGSTGKRIYNKLSAEFEARKELFIKRFEAVAKHNINPKSTFKMAINEFADLNSTESAQHTGLLVPKDGAGISQEDLCKSVPTTCKIGDKRRRHLTGFDTSLDWSTTDNPQGRSVLTRVLNQGRCSNCWAVATTETIESAYAIAANEPAPVLSISQTTNCYAKSCARGTVEDALKYTMETGLSTEQEFPYQNGEGKEGVCIKHTPQIRPKKYSVSPYVLLSSFSSVKAKDAAVIDLLKNGPIILAFHADPNPPILAYDSGIIDDYAGCGNDLNHAAQLVGYGQDNGKKYWKIRNSWGQGWGEEGFVRLERGNPKHPLGMCGMLQYAYFIPNGVELVSGSGKGLKLGSNGKGEPGAPVPCERNLHLTDTKATCKFGGCKSARHAVCEDGKCVCAVSKDDGNRRCSDHDTQFSSCELAGRLDGDQVFTTSPAKKCVKKGWFGKCKKWESDEDDGGDVETAEDAAVAKAKEDTPCKSRSWFTRKCNDKLLLNTAGTLTTTDTETGSSSNIGGGEAVRLYERKTVQTVAAVSALTGLTIGGVVVAVVFKLAAKQGVLASTPVALSAEHCPSARAAL
jgi:hypothetical protein